MTIRKMTITDYEAAYKLWAETEGVGIRSIDDSFEGIERFIKRNPETNFVCVVDHELAGVILSGHDGRRGYIYHAVVNKNYRKQGIGKKLVEEVLVALKTEGITKVVLVVYANNIGGNNFWESVGFSQRDDLVYRNKSLEILND